MVPKYTVWQSIEAAIALGTRALEEVRAIASRPPPRDGFGFDDMSVDYDGERTVILRFEKDGEIKEFPILFPIVLYRGIHKEDKSYLQGDMVTWQGSVWIAQRDTSKHPRDAEDWKLAVKAGRDGRNLKNDNFS